MGSSFEQFVMYTAILDIYFRFITWFVFLTYFLFFPLFIVITLRVLKQLFLVVGFL